MGNEALLRLLFRIPPRLIVIITLALHPCHAREVFAADVRHVFVEFAHRVVNFLEVADLEASHGLGERGIRCMDAVVHAEGLVLGQGGGCLACIADLASVPASCLVDVGSKVALCEIEDAVNVDIHCCALAPLELLEIGFPDLHRLLVLERWVVKLGVDSRHECFVQDSDAVGG